VAKWEGEFDEEIFNRNNEEVNGDR
jgi:hypothetical protein